MCLGEYGDVRLVFFQYLANVGGVRLCATDVLGDYFYLVHWSWVSFDVAAVK
jgi:hypothetical protein